MKVTRKFLFVPRWLYNDCGEESIRWLEFATIEYVYVSGGYDGWPHWKAIRFIDAVPTKESPVVYTGSLGE
ncbi:MAG: hypothetical protein WC315_00895 [Candidatus Omnitrophota bacterium]|jgi:hypothetical protein